MHSPQATTSLVIGHLWDGALARPDEAVVMLLTPEAGGLRVEVIAPTHGDPPPTAPAGSTDRLWEHEVVELFVASAESRETYLEVELGPHGHHLVLQLEGVRRPVATGLPLSYKAQVEGDFWQGEAWIPERLLPPAPWVINATAIHGQGAERRYLSWLPLPGPAPDYHQPHRFVPVGDLGPIVEGQ
ncbi:MAG: hypothetical protein H6741_04845 [Alphaproteobacteria bacterium]|nr:hypothetical protein [Alphaproteobacteria bacterium]MCB9792036.1 hypothetical protein [Alphaproteobacteria bacterium]